MNTSLFERAKYLFITLSAVVVVFAIPTWAQDEDEDAAELGKIGHRFSIESNRY